MARGDYVKTVTDVMNRVLDPTAEALDVVITSGTGGTIGSISINQTTPGTTNRVAAGGVFATVAVEVTRTSGVTTAYVAKQVYNAAVGLGLTFANLARLAGGSGVIVKARLTTDQKANVARFRLHLWNVAPTFLNDYANFLYLYANEANYQGFIDFDALATEDPTSSTAAYSQKVGNLLPFVCGATASLFGELEVLDAFTPASAQKVTVTLTASQN